MRVSKILGARFVAGLLTIVTICLLAHHATKWAEGLLQMQKSVAAGKVTTIPSRAVASGSRNPAVTIHVGAEMSSAFDKGVLPAPLALPRADPDDAAAILAKQIAARDANSTAALMTALQMAGFAIRNRDGSLLKPAGASQGLAFEAWEVAAIGKLYGAHWQISLDDVQAALERIMPELHQAPFGALFLKGIASSAQGEQPLRFWSRLTVELGRNSDHPYDLLAPTVDQKSVWLDPIQFSLILKRLGGDLVAAKNAASTNVRKSAFQREFRQQPPQLELAIYRPDLPASFQHAPESQSEQQSESQSPCFFNQSEIGQTILDGTAIGLTTEWKNIIQIEAQEEAASVESKFSAAAVIMKFIFTYASLNVNVTSDKSPLVRTYDLDPGETATLTAHVYYDTGDWSNLNCLRPLLNTVGLDFPNLPTSGAVEGAGVSWTLTEGGVPWTNPNDYDATIAAQYQGKVMFDNGGGTDGETYNKVTDENGDTTVKVSGRPQQRDLTNLKRAPVNSQYAVAVQVKVKGADPKKFLGELTDVLGPALGLSSGDIIGGLAGGITETAYRMSWPIGGSFVFPLQDWAADGAWTGSITVSATRTESMGPTTKTFPSGKVNTDSYKLNSSLQGTFTLNGDGSSQNGSYSGTGTEAINFNQDTVWDGSSKWIDTCNSAQAQYATTSHEERAQKSTGATQSFMVSVVPTDLSGGKPQKYSVNLAGQQQFPTTTEQSGINTFSGCDKNTSSPWGGPAVAGSAENVLPSFEAPVNPQSPLTLQGDTTVANTYYGEMHIHWDLTMH
jgi:hypothetical protein